MQIFWVPHPRLEITVRMTGGGALQFSTHNYVAEALASV